MFTTVQITVEQYVVTTYTDAPSGTLILSGSLVEAKVYTNTTTGSLTESGTSTEAKVYGDSRSGSITQNGSLVEAKVYAETPSGSLTGSGSQSDAHTQAPAVTGTLTLSGSSGAAGADTDAQTGSLTLSGTLTEARSATDAPSGSLTLSGTSTAVAADTDAQTGTLTLSGTLDDYYFIETIYADEQSGTVTFTGTLDEETTYTDEPVGIIGGQTGPPQVVYVNTGYRIAEPPDVRHVHDETIILVREYSDAPRGVLSLSGFLAETYAAPLPPAVEQAFDDLIVATERVVEHVEVPVEVPILIPVTTRADSQYGAITFTGTIVETYTAPPSVEDELDQLINSDPTILFEVFDHA